MPLNQQDQNSQEPIKTPIKSSLVVISLKENVVAEKSHQNNAKFTLAKEQNFIKVCIFRLYKKILY